MLLFGSDRSNDENMQDFWYFWTKRALFIIFEPKNRSKMYLQNYRYRYTDQDNLTNSLMTLANEAVSKYTIYTVHVRAFRHFKMGSKISGPTNCRRQGIRKCRKSDPFFLAYKSFLNVSIRRDILNTISLSPIWLWYQVWCRAKPLPAVKSTRLLVN